MVRRIIAYFIDLAIYAAAVLIPLRLLAGTMNVADSASPIFGVDAPDRVGRIDGDGIYAFQGDTVYTLTRSEATTAALIGLGVFLLLAVVLQGLSGRTVGKFVTGVRAVRPDGSRPGIIRAFIRELCWIIDGIPSLVVPLVGGILALVTTGRRRIGDMLGRTYVVHRQFAGSAIVHPDKAGDGSADVEAADAPASDVAVAAAAAPAAEATTDTAVTDDRAATEAAWAGDQPAAAADGPDAAPDPVPAESQTADEPATVPAESQTTDEPATPATQGDEPTAPQWDPDRRAYISYDPRRGGWVQHDAESGEWGPISRA